MDKEIKCVKCIQVKIDNPNVPEKNLFPRGEVENAITIFEGTAYCKTHFKLRATKRSNNNNP